MKHVLIVAILCISGLICTPPNTFGDDAAPQAISDQELTARICREGDRLIAEGVTTPAPELVEQLSRKTAEVALPKHQAKPLGGEGVYDRARRATLIVGGLYKCDKCTHTHSNSAAGFVITESGVAVTNYHVLDNKTNMTFIAMAQDGTVYPVKEVLAADKDRDVAIVQLEGEKFQPLPLGDAAGVGADVYVLSHPSTRFFSFTRGIVSRYFNAGPQRGGATVMQITADYARGSSGGPILNDRAEVVGMVASTMSVYYNEEGGQPRNLQMVFKDCVSAESIRGLLQSPTAAAKKTPEKKQKS